MSSAYTKAEWIADSFIIKTSNGNTLFFEDSCLDDYTRFKNVELAAAAPDLLDALQNLLLSYCDGFDYEDDELVIKARAAITKATGTTQ